MVGNEGRTMSLGHLGRPRILDKGMEKRMEATGV